MSLACFLIGVSFDKLFRDQLFQEVNKNYTVLQVVRNGFTADGIFDWISIYLAQKYQNPFFTKIDKNKPKKYGFDEISKTQMPEGTLNRTFCLSKINFSSFFCLFVIFWLKDLNFLAFLAIFGQKLSFFGQKCYFNEFLKKVHPKRDFIEIFEKKCPKTRFYKHFATA